MNMPILRPLTIKTKGLPLFTRLKRWIFSIRQWELVVDWEYPLFDGTLIIIPQGFVFDGASIPRIFWAILSPIGLLLIPGLVHDFGYRYQYLWAIDNDGEYYKYKVGSKKPVWDQIFKEVGKDVNGMKVIDFIAWIALVIGGESAWRLNRDNPVPELEPGKIHEDIQNLCEES